MVQEFLNSECKKLPKEPNDFYHVSFLWVAFFLFSLDSLQTTFLGCSSTQGTQSVSTISARLIICVHFCKRDFKPSANVWQHQLLPLQVDISADMSLWLDSRDINSPLTLSNSNVIVRVLFLRPLNSFCATGNKIHRHGMLFNCYTPSVNFHLVWSASNPE